MTEFLPGEKIVGPSLMHEDRREVSGTYVRPFGMGHPRALMVQLADETRCVIDADAARYQNPRMSDSLRNLADVLDNNPTLAKWFSFEMFSQHLTKEQVSELDEFAEMFNTEVKPWPEKYVAVLTQIGPIELRLQALRADYEKFKVGQIGQIS